MRKKGKLTSTDLLRRDAASSGSIQDDAAAGDEDDGALCGGGGARAVGVRDRKKKRQGERMERPAGFIYKEKGISGRRKNRGA